MADAGLTIVGTPARKAGANFSSMPQTGKLKALTWKATPGRRSRTCWPPNEPSRDRFSGGPSTSTCALGSSRRPFDP